MPAIAGVAFATAEAGIKHKNRTDVLLAVFDKGTEVAGVFTRSKCRSAPVDWCAAALPVGQGAGAPRQCRQRQRLHRQARPRDRAALRRDGGAGARLPAEAGLPRLDRGDRRAARPGEVRARHRQDGGAASRADRWPDAARAIMTTDTFPKLATRTVAFGDATVTINGIAKGAGMIAPDMATMLSFVMTDAPIAAPVLQALLVEGRHAAASTRSPSTATPRPPTRSSSSPPARRAGAAPVTSLRDRRIGAFREALDDLLLDLAHQVVRDGEGARKFVEVRVEGAVSKASAKRIALSIANSPLVKTAIAGEDANWGRDRHGRRQGRRAGRPRPPRHLLRRHPRRGEGRARPGLFRGRDLGLHEERGDRHHGRHRPRQGQATASGPATSPRNTSRSTATTGR